jgi:hypothetical protein
MPVSRKRKLPKPRRAPEKSRSKWLAPGPWLAARMARDALRSRDELIAWFDTSPAAPAKVRSAFQRLVDFDDHAQHVVVHVAV